MNVLGRYVGKYNLAFEVFLSKLISQLNKAPRFQ
jgi:hypothetical protein